LSVDKKGKVQMKCSACGAKAPVRLSKLCASQFHKSTSVCGVQVDQSHKVVKEILKYPPGSEKKDGKKEKKGNPNGKKARRQALKESNPLDDVDGEEAGDEAAAPEPEPQGARPEEDEEAKAARRKKEKEEKKLRKAEKAAKRAAKEGRIERKEKCTPPLRDDHCATATITPADLSAAGLSGGAGSGGGGGFPRR
jgi:hypothetical protein